MCLGKGMFMNQLGSTVYSQRIFTKQHLNAGKILHVATEQVKGHGESALLTLKSVLCM
jgi:hypothetical protein